MPSARITPTWPFILKETHLSNNLLERSGAPADGTEAELLTACVKGKTQGEGVPC